MHPVVPFADMRAAGLAARFPGPAITQELRQRGGAIGGGIWREERAGDAIVDQFTVPANVGCGNQLALGHRFQRLERSYEIRQPAALARIGHYVRQRVIALHLVMRDPAGKTNGMSHAQRIGLGLEYSLAGAPPPTSNMRASGWHSSKAGIAEIRSSSPS